MSSPIISRSSSPTKGGPGSTEDTLARQSDVIVSTNVTLYAEYKGFFIYVISAVILVCWAGWSLIPNKVLQEQLYIYYIPDKYWSLAIPSYSLMLLLYGYIYLALYDREIKTIPLDDIRNFVDEYSVFVTEGEQGEKIDDVTEFLCTPTPGVRDLPVTLVNEVLYNSDDNDDNEY